MRSYVHDLRELATAILSGCSDIRYVARISIERSLFVTAKRIAIDHLGYDLRNFGISAREAVETSGARKRIVDTLLLAFEIRAALGNLTSTHPYVTADASSQFFEGRQEAIRLLANSCLRYADQAEALLAEAPK